MDQQLSPVPVRWPPVDADGVIGYNVQATVETAQLQLVDVEQAKEGTRNGQTRGGRRRGYFDGRDISPEEAGVAVTSPKPMTSNGTRRAVRQTGLCLPALMRTSTAAHPASSCLSLRTSSTRRRCTVTGRQQRAKVARSRDKILRQRSATSRAESKSMWSNWSRRSSIPIPTPCGHDARGGASLRHYLYGCDPIPDEGP